MRTWTTLLGLCCVALGGCLGEIGGADDGATTSVKPPPDQPNSAPTCDPTKAALTASPIKRLAKAYVQNAIAELLSPLSDAQRTAFVASIQTRIDLVPADEADTYKENDDNVTQDHVDAMFGLAVALGTKLTAPNAGYEAALLAPCGAGMQKTALDQDACLTSFVQYYGRKAFRRPMTDAEVLDFKAFYQEAKAKNVDAMAALFTRFVAHPRFYYRFDAEGALTEGSDGVDGVYELTSWELLSKVTFLFWAAPPSDQLYDLVAKTDLTDDAALSALLDQVLADPKAERGVMSFYREWLALEKTKMPATDGNIAAGTALLKASGIDALPDTHREDMIQEVLDLAKHYTLSTEGSLEDVLTSDVSFARTDALAKIYGVSAWDGSKDHLVKLPANERAGLLTRAAFLASNTEYTRPILKGKEVRTRLLCTPVPLPPPNVKITPLTHPKDKSTRQVTEEATSNATCQACHGPMNPFGFASEGFDPIGRVRATELRFADGTGTVIAHLPLDTKVSIDVGDDKPQAIDGALSLGKALATSGQVHSCLVRNYFELVAGRAGDPTTDGCDLVRMRERLAGTDGSPGSIKSMLKATVLLASFRHRKAL